MDTIVLVSRNPGKLSEIRNLLPDSFILKSLDDLGCYDEIAETGSTFRENALIKAKFVSEKYNVNTLADDSGLEVDALKSAPGVLSARFAGEKATDTENINKLLFEMRSSTKRKARFKTVLALNLNGKTHFFEGKVEGSIALNPSGSNGFGYDPVFIPEGYSQTFGELSSHVKNTISHRAAAIRQLAQFLRDRSS
jgi:XTP/dITP diphosphohydrolase